ncbi:hypothetical protein POW71_16285, partial [Klebsiella pneumoniae]
KHAYCLKTQPATGETYPKSDLFNKAAVDAMDTATETHAAISRPVPYGMGYIRTSLSGRNKHNGHSAGGTAWPFSSITTG